ncbi:MAG: SsrA-binding protein [Metamycoplasmataceae bacterium]
MSKTISNNKRISFDYEIIDKYEAGISLMGWEVKSARANTISLINSYCSIYKNEIYLKDSYFKQYMNVKCKEFRTRKLLMHKNEIVKLKRKIETEHLTLVPTKIYFNQRSKIKIEIALVKGLKKYDKREKIKARDVERKIEKNLKFY